MPFSCNGNNNNNPVAIPLPDIVPNQFNKVGVEILNSQNFKLNLKKLQENLAEIRGLYINLKHRTDVKQYSMKEFKYKEAAGRHGKVMLWQNRK